MATKTAEKKPSIFHSFYGGKVTVEQKPWGDHYRVTVNGQSGVLSVTRVTKNLDKSQALIPWATKLVGSKIAEEVEKYQGDTVPKDMLRLFIANGINAPEDAKKAGGETGDAIHEYAKKFAEAQMNVKPLPKIPKIDESTEEGKKIANGLNGFLDFFNSHHVLFKKAERLVYFNSFYHEDKCGYHSKVEYYGYADLVAIVDGELVLLDYKTGKRLYTDMRYQVSAYVKAWNANPDNEKVRSAIVLIFNKETGEFVKERITMEEVEKDFNAFVGLYFTALREEELKKA